MDTTGRIGLVYGGRDFWARVIVKVTDSPVHHVILDLGDGTCASAELDGGVVRLPLEHFPRVRWIEVGTAEQRHAAAAHAVSVIETEAPYNRIAFAFAGLYSLGVLPPKLEKRIAHWVSRHGYICSSLVDSCFIEAGLDLFPGVEPIFIWPGRLAELLLTEQPSETGLTSCSSVSISSS